MKKLGTKKWKREGNNERKECINHDHDNNNYMMTNIEKTNTKNHGPKYMDQKLPTFSVLWAKMLSTNVPGEIWRDHARSAWIKSFESVKMDNFKPSEINYLQLANCFTNFNYVHIKYFSKFPISNYVNIIAKHLNFVFYCNANYCEIWIWRVPIDLAYGKTPLFMDQLTWKIYVRNFKYV